MSPDLHLNGRTALPEGRQTRHGDRQPLGRRAFWWLYAQMYDAIWDSPLTAHLAAAILSAAPAEGPVVDLGCGTGLVGAHYRGIGHHVTGVDTSTAMLRVALVGRRISAGVHVSATQTPLPAGGAGTVLLCNVLHLQRDPHAVLVEAARLAEPAGLIVVTWPVDGLTPARMRTVDRATGRGRLASIRADVLRRLVGTLFTYSREPLRSDNELLHVIEAATASGALSVCSQQTVLECQRLFVLRTPSSSETQLTVVEAGNPMVTMDPDYVCGQLPDLLLHQALGK